MFSSYVKIVYILSYREFCVEYKTIKKLSQSLLFVSTLYILVKLGKCLGLLCAFVIFGSLAIG